jgi:hypothetical protein
VFSLDDYKGLSILSASVGLLGGESLMGFGRNGMVFMNVRVDKVMLFLIVSVRSQSVPQSEHHTSPVERSVG